MSQQEPSYGSTVDLLEAMAQQTWVAVNGSPGPAAALRQAAQDAAPEFERVWESGAMPVITLDVTGGCLRLVVEVAA